MQPFENSLLRYFKKDEWQKKPYVNTNANFLFIIQNTERKTMYF